MNQCRKVCGGRMRPMCYVSTACRLAIIPAVWWGIFGFGGHSGVDMLRDMYLLSTGKAALGVAFVLALVSTAALMPCSIHKMFLNRRACACKQKKNCK